MRHKRDTHAKEREIHTHTSERERYTHTHKRERETHQGNVRETRNTCVIRMRDMTHSHVGHDSFICGT